MPQVTINEQMTLGDAVSDSVGNSPFVFTVVDLHNESAIPHIPFNRTFCPWPALREPMRITLTEHQDNLQITFSNIRFCRHIEKLRSTDVHGCVMRLWQGFLDIERNEANLAALFEGEIDRISGNEQALVVNLIGNAKYLSKSGLVRTFSVDCPFQFKSRQCGYRGPDTDCDKSLSDCQSKGNRKNFGGFGEFLSIQGTREII